MTLEWELPASFLPLGNFDKSNFDKLECEEACDIQISLREERVW